MNAEVFAITPDNLLPYLASLGLLGEERGALVRELGGGVSNIVLMIEWPNHPERRWVAKQALEKLRVQDDWPADRARIFREAEAIQTLRPALGDTALPSVIHIDRTNYFFVMTAARRGSFVWKEALLAGRVDLAVASRAGTLLGRMINASRTDPALRKQFEDRSVFDQLRIDPYYRTTAARHPDVRKALEDLIRDSWQIQTSLVHGDYSPKNLLIGKDQETFLIDFEVIHWGDPGFDTGFMINHLLLKALYQPRFALSYFDAAKEFWQALLGEVKDDRADEFEARTLRHLGGLMLARIDGKSPVEYIRDDRIRERVRRVAKKIILGRPQRLNEAMSLALEEMQ